MEFWLILWIVIPTAVFVIFLTKSSKKQRITSSTYSRPPQKTEEVKQEPKELVELKRRVEARILLSHRARGQEDFGSDGCAVYVIQSRNGIKIGNSTHPESRLKQLQTSQATDLKLIDTVWFDSKKSAAYVEKEVHQVLRRSRMRGEWFNITSTEAISTIEDVILRNSDLKDDESILTDFEKEVLNSKWYKSAKGNLWTSINDHRLTVFYKKMYGEQGGYRYVYCRALSFVILKELKFES
jgi:hypothetical protein